MLTKAVIVGTQCLENYGDPDKPYWKSKGGDSYWVATILFDEGQEPSETALRNGLAEVMAKYETRDSAMWIEMIRSVSLVDLREARRRANIDRNAVYCEDYFDYVAVRDIPPTYILGGAADIVDQAA